MGCLDGMAGGSCFPFRLGQCRFALVNQKRVLITECVYNGLQCVLHFLGCSFKDSETAFAFVACGVHFKPSDFKIAACAISMGTLDPVKFSPPIAI